MAAKLKSGRGYNRIYRRMLITLLLLAVTPLVCLGWFAADRLNAIYDEKTMAGIEALTSSKRRSLDTFLNERVAQIKNLAFTHSYAELSDATKLSRIFSVMQANGKSFVDIGVINLEGKHEAYVGPYSLMEANYQDASWFVNVLSKGTYVSDVFLGKRNVPHFIIAVLRHDGAHSFILRATIDMEAIDELLQRVYSGKHADAFLLSDEGVLQTNSQNFGHCMEHSGLAVKDLDPSKIAIKYVDNPENFKTGSRTFMAAFAHLESMPWTLVVADDPKESLVPLSNLRLMILGFVLIGSVLVVFGAFFSTRKLIAYIMEKDRQQATIDARLLQSSKMAALGKMAAGVAHEVNNPLMLIQENAGWISDLLADEDRSRMKNYDEIATSCEKISANVMRARTITQRMLGFGRRMNPSRAEVLLNVIADHVVDLLRNEASNHNVRIEKKYSESVPVVLSDPAQLEQVVLNIVDNAIDAIGRNGTVIIQTFAAPNGWARISITDTGPGLDEATKSRIFDPFFTTKDVGEGTGLGLAICYSILEKLGGRIEVKSKIGVGTTFTVSLPPEPPQEEQDPFDTTFSLPDANS